MARPIWSGAINFGLVSVPVRLYSATHDHTVHFHQIQRGTSSRVRNRRVNEKTGKQVDLEDIVKGYEVDDGEYVVVEPDELDDIAPGRSQTLDVVRFVDLDEIDPVSSRSPTGSRRARQRPQALRPVGEGDGQDASEPASACS